MTYIALGISLASLAVSIYVYFKGPKQKAEDLAQTKAPRIPGARY